MNNKSFCNLVGKMLIASPYSKFNDMFQKSVLYVLSHSREGAVGLIVNHQTNRIPLKSLVAAIKSENHSNVDAFEQEKLVTLHVGGPIEIERGFVLHTNEYKKNLLFRVENGLSVSSNTEILKDLALDKGPKDSLFVVGYTGWVAGQLEAELENNFWIACSCDPKIIFLKDNSNKWDAAMKKIGLNHQHFASDFSHC